MSALPSAAINAVEGRTADPRFRRSLDALLAAVTALIDEAAADGPPLAAISITAVVRRAGVTRPTFYQHFPSVEAAAQQAALARLSAAYPMPEPGPPGPARSGGAPPAETEIQHRIERHVLPILHHLQAHRAFYLRVLEGAGTAGFFDELVAFLSARLLPGGFEAAARRSGAAAADVMTVHAGGIMWLAIRWLRDEAAGGMADPVAATDAGPRAGAAPEAMARRLARAATALLPPPMPAGT